MVKLMTNKNTRELHKYIDDFFKGKAPYVPHISFLDINKSADNNNRYFVVALLKDTNNALLPLIKAFQDTNLSILSFHIEQYDDNNIAYVVAEKSQGGKNSPYSLDKALKGVDEIIDYRYKNLSSFEQNPFTYPITTKKGEQINTVDLVYGLYHAMTRIIPNTLGSGGDYILHMAGINAAQFIWDYYEVSKIDDSDEQFALMEDILRTIGFGIVTFEDLDPLRSKGRIIVENSLESCKVEGCPYWDICEMGKIYEARGTACTFTKGLLIGILHRIFEDNLIGLVETSCITKGDRHCIFELTSARG